MSIFQVFFEMGAGFTSGVLCLLIPFFMFKNKFLNR
jgi:hypothetical protein